jgi:uncharacterized membrane protein
MTEMSCPDCKITVPAGTMNCPKCGQHKSYFVQIGSEKQNVSEARKNNGANDAKSGSSAHIAIESAQIVNGYGTFIQVFGILLGILTAIFGFWLASKSGLFSVAIGGIIAGAFICAISAIQGALFRMLANYVIARLEKK